jgi:heat shock protein HslJ
VLTLGAAGLMLPTACSTPPPVVTWTLTGTVWKLVELNGEMIGLTRLPSLTLDPSTKRVSGAAGVNTFNGTYTLQDASLSFGPLATTRMAGSEKEMKVEADFLQALGRATSWKMKSPYLALYAGETLLARFQAMPAGSPL